MPPKIRLSVMLEPLGAIPPIQLLPVVHWPLKLVFQVKLAAWVELIQAPPASTLAMAALSSPRRRRFFDCAAFSSDVSILDISLSQGIGQFLTSYKYKRCSETWSGFLPSAMHTDSPRPCSTPSRYTTSRP